jgi:hypothetical protein
MVGRRISETGAGAASIATASGVAVAGTAGNGVVGGSGITVDIRAVGVGVTAKSGEALPHPANPNITEIKFKREYQNLSLFIFACFNPR